MILKLNYWELTDAVTRYLREDARISINFDEHDRSFAVECLESEPGRDGFVKKQLGFGEGDFFKIYIDDCEG